ncbi:DUF427 domain-containing protein [Arthrobacter echini]|uniref:DUF427 domain-containing protein n=1 Tax=Arthrobacter echini TaxID=1529066 RepID=A0A4V3Z5A5_9MICC|nr:DUF427 domain-containing protein [Arthrobacter echini]THJ65819.1 DUF427 domain-containing protein [Arthrobacter echini]
MTTPGSGKRVQPGPGQESVWDYPRPPRVERSSARIEVRFGGQLIAATSSAVRVLETSHPPVHYLPIEDFLPGVLKPVDGSTHCEFKGAAAYFDVVAGTARSPRGAWTYPRPVRGYEDLSTRAAIYPAQMDSCTVDGERVQAQEGGFYGGWITSMIAGPFKGGAGTWGW